MAGVVNTVWADGWDEDVMTALVAAMGRDSNPHHISLVYSLLHSLRMKCHNGIGKFVVRYARGKLTIESMCIGVAADSLRQPLHTYVVSCLVDAEHPLFVGGSVPPNFISSSGSCIVVDLQQEDVLRRWVEAKRVHETASCLGEDDADLGGVDKAGDRDAAGIVPRVIYVACVVCAAVGIMYAAGW